MWIVRASLIAAVLVLILGRMEPMPQSALAASAAESTEILHEVQPGDNLHLIAGYYYGDARQWTRIWKANRGQISNPNRLALGSSLRVPDGTAPVESYADFTIRVRTRASVSPVSGAASPTLQPLTTPAAQSPGPPSPRK